MHRLSAARCGRAASANRWCRKKSAAPLGALVEAGLEIGYCARSGQVDVRLSAHGGDGEKIVRTAEAVVQGNSWRADLRF